MDGLEGELASDYERQRWEDFTDRYYCDEYANTLRRLMEDYNGCPRFHMSIDMEPKRMK
jgi:hypothetical protein